jgi:hypothetical protein
MSDPAKVFQAAVSRQMDSFKSKPAVKGPSLFSGSFQIDLSGLPDYQREQVARHLDQTYNMRYGGLERSEMNFFRVGIEQCRRTEPEAVFLRELAQALHSGAVVKLNPSDMDQRQRYAVSELLRRSARRIQGGDPRDAPVADALALLAATWDKAAKVSSDPQERSMRISGYRG